MLDDLVITGSGGGGGKGGGSGGGLSERADTLKATSYAQILDLLCEGEIGGLVNGLQSIYADDTPIQNPDGTLNFKNVTYAHVTGTQSQAAISGFDSVSNEISVAVEAKTYAPVTRTITNTNVTSVVVTVQFPQLTYMDDKGNLGGTSVQYAIDVQNNGGGFKEVVNQTVTGKSSSEYNRQHRIVLPAGGPWDIRLRRITSDSTSSSLNNKTFLKSYAEIIDAKLRYPNSALVAIKIDASQFKSIPKRGYDVKLLKIRIPTNATVNADGSLTYSGSWDGTFKVAWCACPAWAFYDMITMSRYGLGRFISASQIDKWSIYSISKYCNQLVPDGFGGQEPRFTCNLLIDNEQEAFKWVNDMASIFRAMPYWATGTVTLAQDAPADPSYLFTNGNVVDGRFTYEGSSAKQRHTVALVTWNDPKDMYRQHVEYVEDADGIARYGIVEAQVVALGCTSRGQAHRVGRWLLYSEKYETETVTFKTGQEGVFLLPGAIIKVADQYRAGQRLGGRVSSSTSNTLTVDNIGGAPTLPATLYVADATGSISAHPVQGIAGNVITITDTFAQLPPAQAPWVLATASVDAQTFRVISIEEQEDGTFQVSALKHNPSKYGYIENGLTLQQRTYTSLSPVPDTVATVSLSESLYRYQNDVRSKVTAYWPAAANATAYRVRWRQNNGNWSEDVTSALDYEILNTTPGYYEVQVTSVGVFGTVARASTTASITALGKTTPPSDVSNFAAIIDAKIGITLNWSAVTDLDIDHYEIRTGPSWSAGTLVASVAATSFKLGAIFGSAQTYWIKAVDTTGNYSANAVSATASLLAPSAPGQPTTTVIDNNVLLKWANSSATLAIDYYEVRKGAAFASAQVVGQAKSTFSSLFETSAGSYTYWVVAVDIGGNYGTPVSVTATVAPPPNYQLLLSYQSTFNGTKSNAVVDGGRLYIGIDTSETVQSHFDSRSWASPQDQVNAGYSLFAQPTPATGYYEEVLDYGTTISACKVSVVPTMLTEIGNPTITPKISVSNTSATGPWTDFAGQSEAYASSFRWVKVRYDIAGGAVSISSMLIKLDAKQKEDFGAVAANAADASGTVVNFQQSFVSVTSIQVTPQGSTAALALYDFAGGANPTSFNVYLFDKNGNRISGNVSWSAKGY